MSILSRLTIAQVAPPLGGDATRPCTRRRWARAARRQSSAAADRLLAAFGSIRDGLADGIDVVQEWPIPTRRLAAGFTLGLALGLTLRGIPRLVATAALVPAIGFAASALGSETTSGRRDGSATPTSGAPA